MILVLIGYSYCHSVMAKIPVKFEDANYTFYFILSVVLTVIALQLTKR